MEKMNDLNDLLKHEIMDLYSAEEQIVAAMPAMIEKAKNPELVKALQQHLRVTEGQRKRLDQVMKHMGLAEGEKGKDSGLFNRLFKSRQVCKGMQGIIEEGTRVMKEDMDPDVMDAAILASSQKIEHYEICGYGTARSFAEELQMTEVARLLQQTLDEEYEADQLLTRLAVSRVNREAESGRGRSTGSRPAKAGRVREEEPEMEMVASSRSRRGSSEKSTTAPRGGATRGTDAESRGTGSTRRVAATASKTQSGNSRNASGNTTGRTTGARGNGSGRGNTRG